MKVCCMYVFICVCFFFPGALSSSIHSYFFCVKVNCIFTTMCKSVCACVFVGKLKHVFVGKWKKFVPLLCLCEHKPITAYLSFSLKCQI